MRTTRTWCAGLAAATLALTSCGGGSDDASSSSPESSSAAPADGATEGGVEVVDVDDPADLELAAARTAADLVVDELGDGALDAVVAAVAAGYSYSQIVGAVGAGKLHADGSIEDVEPEHEASDELRLTALPHGSDRNQVAIVLARSGEEPQTLRDAMLAEGRKIDPRRPEKGAIAFILMLQGSGYGPTQIQQVLLRPDDYVLRTVESTSEGSSGGHIVQVEDSCTLVFDSATGTVLLPELRPEDTACRRAVYRLDEQAEREVFVDGELTSGAILAGEAITEVLVNELHFLLLPDDGLAVGDGTVSRRAVIPGDDCEDRKISPLGFTFEGEFVDEEQARLEGTFTYRVKAEEYVDEGDCHPLTSFGTGAGSWQADWSADEGVWRGELTVASGSFGTNEFELHTAG